MIDIWILKKKLFNDPLYIDEKGWICENKRIVIPFILAVLNNVDVMRFFLFLPLLFCNLSGSPISD